MGEGAALASATELCDMAGDSAGALDSMIGAALVVGDDVSPLALDVLAITGNDVTTPEDPLGPAVVAIVAVGEEVSSYDLVFGTLAEA